MMILNYTTSRRGTLGGEKLKIFDFFGENAAFFHTKLSNGV